MSSNIEDFLIQFGFKDEGALKHLNSINTAMDKMSGKFKKSEQASDKSTNKTISNLTRTKNAIAKFNKSAIANNLRAGGASRAEMRNHRNNYVAATQVRGSRQRAQALREVTLQMQKQNLLLRRNTKATMKLGVVSKGLVDSSRNMVRQYASLFALFATTNAINKAGQGFEAMRSAMLAAMGTVEEAAKAEEFLTGMTRRLGFSLLETADQYTKFVFASKGKLDTEQVNTFFQSMAEAGTVLGVTKDRMRLSFNAVQQMMNKTTVASEELRRQLAESFPGAVQIFARAAGTTEKGLFEMMKAGELLAADILPLVGEEMKKVANTAGALDAKLLTTRIAQGRFLNELELAMNTIFTSGFDKGLAGLLETITVWMANNKKQLELLGETFKLVFSIIKTIIQAVTPIITLLNTVIGAFSKTLNQIPWSGTAIGVGILIAILSKFITASKGVRSAALVMWAAVFAPIVLVVAGITLLIALLDEFHALMVDGKTGILEDLIGKDINIKDTWIYSLFEFISDTMEEVKEGYGLLTNLGKFIGGSAFDIVDSIPTTIKGIEAKGLAAFGVTPTPYPTATSSAVTVRHELDSNIPRDSAFVQGVDAGLSMANDYGKDSIGGQQ